LPVTSTGHDSRQFKIRDKRFDLMTPVPGKRRAPALVDTIWEIEKAREARTFKPLLQA